MSAVGYACQEALASIRRAARSAAVSMATIAIAFFTLGSFLLLSANLQRVVERWAAAAELSVYLQDDASQGEYDALQQFLQTHRAVAAVETVSKEQALQRFRADFPELADLERSLENPFPASFEVRLQSGVLGADEAAALANGVRQYPGVADVRYDRQWLSRLLGALTTVRVLALAAAAVLVLGAAFTVAAIVRLSLQSRRAEVEIMQLVGAPYSFIRGPFVAEGAILSTAGAAVALTVLWLTYRSLQVPLHTALAEWAGMGEVRFLSWREVLGLLLVSAVIGSVSGLVAARGAREA